MKISNGGGVVFLKFGVSLEISPIFQGNAEMEDATKQFTSAAVADMAKMAAAATLGGSPSVAVLSPPQLPAATLEKLFAAAAAQQQQQCSPTAQQLLACLASLGNSPISLRQSPAAIGAFQSIFVNSVSSRKPSSDFLKSRILRRQFRISFVIPNN